MTDNDEHYSRNYRSPDVEAREAAARYEIVSAEHVNDWLIELLPDDKACILDVGSGSGRDAGWLASLEHEVIAVEPKSRDAERVRTAASPQQLQAAGGPSPRPVGDVPHRPFIRLHPRKRRLNVRGAEPP